jgi:hypothetical protein
VATRTFDLTTTVGVTPTATIDFLLDLNRHRGLHPYLQSATVVETGSDAAGPWSQWDVVERPRLGPFRYSIRFPARMQRTSSTSMLGTVRAAPGCYLTTVTTAVEVDGQTQLSETTTVTAPWLLVGYMSSQARIAHTRTYSLLPAELATTGH